MSLVMNATWAKSCLPATPLKLIIRAFVVH